MKSFLTFLVYFYVNFDFLTGIGYEMGRFNQGDFMVASELLFREKAPFGFTIAKYGRMFKCPITYFRIDDRLNMGDGPKLQIIRGGLLKKHIVAKLWQYNVPIAVNVKIGCAGKDHASDDRNPSPTQRPSLNHNGNSDNVVEANEVEGHHGEDDEHDDDDDDDESDSKANNKNANSNISVKGKDANGNPISVDIDHDGDGTNIAVGQKEKEGESTTNSAAGEGEGEAVTEGATGAEGEEKPTEEPAAEKPAA